MILVSVLSYQDKIIRYLLVDLNGFWGVIIILEINIRIMFSTRITMRMIFGLK